MSPLVKRLNERGFALIFAIVILAVLSGFSLYFPVAGRSAARLSKDYFYGTQARYLAEAGVETAKARIRNRVLNLPLVGLRVDANGNSSWAEDIDEVYPRGVLDLDFSTEDDGINQDGDGNTDEPGELHPLPAGGQNGFSLEVTDLGRGIDLNYSSPDAPLNSTAANNALRYALARFPLVNEVAGGGTDVLISGGLVDEIIDYRNNELGGRFHSVEELRGVTGMTQAKYDQIKSYVTVHTPSRVVSGGLIAHYYDGINGYPNNVSFDYTTYRGSVIEKGNGGSKAGGSFDFNMNSGIDFEGTQVNGSSYDNAGSDPRPENLTRPAILTNDASSGNPVLATHQLTFGVRWEGYIFIPEDLYVPGNGAAMAFRMIASGGARMKIAGVPIVTTDNYWDSDHDGSSEHSSLDYFQYSGSVGQFSPGWQPIEIEYWCSNRIPVFVLHWNQGFRFRPGSAGDPADPDTDMGSNTLTVPMQSLGYKAGSFYELRSTGIIQNNMGGTEAQKTVVARYRLFDYVHDTTMLDFAQGNFESGTASIRNSFPVIGMNVLRDVNEEFGRTGLHNRNYDTIHNAVKLGYWVNFDDPGDDVNFGGWVARNAETTMGVLDTNGDGDRELAITGADTIATDTYLWDIGTTTTDENIPAIDLVGAGSTIAAPNSTFRYKYFMWRFREHSGRGPLDRMLAVYGVNWKDQLEDYVDPVTNNKNFNSDPGHVAPVQIPDGAITTTCVNPALKAEDKNCTDSVSNYANESIPTSYWVGQPYVKRNDGTLGDILFFSEQYSLATSFGNSGPNDYPQDSGGDNGKELFQFRSNNGRVRINEANYNNSAGYNNAGYEWMYVTSAVDSGGADNVWIWQHRPQAVPSGGFNFTAYHNLGLPADTVKWTLGYRSWGNEVAPYSRAIDNVRILPVSPDYAGLRDTAGGTFVSRALDAGASVTWGVASFFIYPHVAWTPSGGGSTVSGYPGSKATVSFGTAAASGTLPTFSSMGTSSARGGIYAVPSSKDGMRYARYKALFFAFQDNSIDVDVFPPLLEEVTVTYLVDSQAFYVREAVEGD